MVLLGSKSMSSMWRVDMRSGRGVRATEEVKSMPKHDCRCRRARVRLSRRYLNQTNCIVSIFPRGLTGSSPSHHEAIKLCISIYSHSSRLTNYDEIGMFKRSCILIFRTCWFVIKILDGTHKGLIDMSEQFSACCRPPTWSGRDQTPYTYC